MCHQVVRQPKWTVYWDEIDRCADHAYNNLRYESNSGMTLVGVNVDAILATKHLGSADNKVIDRFLATWHPPATPLPLAQNVQVLPQIVERIYCPGRIHHSRVQQPT